MAQIEGHRRAFAALGGSIKSTSSASVKQELEAAQVLGPIMLLLLGIWPFPWRHLSPLALLLVLTGLALIFGTLWFDPTVRLSAVRVGLFVLGVLLFVAGMYGGRVFRSTGR